MRRLIAWVVLATAVCGIAAAWYFRAKSPPVADAPAAAPANVPSPAAPPPVVGAPPSAPKDLKATEGDRLADGPKIRELTPEEQARLDAMRKKYGELQAQIAQGQQAQGDFRASAMGRPDVRDMVTRLKAAREELDRRQSTFPATTAAQQKVRDADARTVETEHARSAFEVHGTAHMADGPDAHKDCGWCYRDAVRMKAKDPALAGVYAAESDRIAKAVAEAAEMRRAAALGLAAARRQAAQDPAIAALSREVAETYAAITARIEALPEYAELKRAEKAARDEQARLASEIAGLYSGGRVAVDAVLAGRAGPGGEKAQ